MAFQFRIRTDGRLRRLPNIQTVVDTCGSIHRSLDAQEIIQSIVGSRILSVSVFMSFTIDAGFDFLITACAISYACDQAVLHSHHDRGLYEIAWAAWQFGDIACVAEELK